MSEIFQRYKRRFRLTGHHLDSIVTVAFNPAGSVLASGGLDGKLLLWSTSLGIPTHVVTSGAGFLCSSWTSDTCLMTGMEDGFLVFIEVAEDFLFAAGFLAHAFPVENVVGNGKFVATGAHSEIKIWKSARGKPFPLQQTLSTPPTGRTHHPIIVTSLNWAPSYAQHALVACYLYHGIVIWNALTSETLLTVPTEAVIGSASLSRDHCHLVVANLSTDIIVYNLRTRAMEWSWRNEPTISPGKLCLPVKFLHGDHAVIGGSSRGLIRLWSDYRQEPLQSLDIAGHPIVLAIDAHDNSSTGRFLLATATAGQGSSCYVQIWEAQPSDEHDILKALRNKRPRRPRCHALHCSMWIFMTAGALLVGLFAIVHRRS